MGCFHSYSPLPRFARRATCVVTAALLAACGGDSSTGPSDTVATVTVTPAGETVLVGGTVTLTAVARDADGNPLTGKSFTWSTSSSAVATVSGGIVTGVSPGGPVTITATSEGKSGTATVTVAPVPVASVEIGPPADTLEVGETHQFAATARSAAGAELAGRTFTWSSADEAIATVSASGLVTAAGPGSTTITAISEGISASMQVSVAGCPVLADPTPTGTLERTFDGFRFTASDGWQITIVGHTVTIPGPNNDSKVEFWGGIHENLNGKHIKDRLHARRSLMLPSGALLTMVHDGLEGLMLTLSIYEGGQSHTVDMQAYKLTHSCADHVPTAVAREGAEADGETASVYYLPNGGTGFRNEYTQDVSETGEPLEKVYEQVLLGETGGPANPNNVVDYFDDPRLGHT